MMKHVLLCVAIVACCTPLLVNAHDCTPEGMQTALDNFNAWFKKGGGRLFGIEVAIGNMYDGRFTVHATREVDDGDAIMEVPPELAITEDTLRFHPVREAFHWQDSLLPGEDRKRSFDRFVLMLMYERRLGKESKWAPYFDMFPDGCWGLPEFYEEDLWDLGRGTLNKVLKNARKNLLMGYQQLFPSLSNKFPELFPKEDTSFEQYLWANAALKTRVLGNAQKDFLHENGTMTQNMIPVLDMLNHHNNKTTVTPEWSFRSMADPFVIETVEDLEKGTEVFNFYEDMSNTHALTRYGFTLTDNYYDRLLFEAPRHMFKEWQLGLMNKSDIHTAVWLYGRDTPGIWEVVRVARVIIGNEESKTMGTEEEALKWVREFYTLRLNQFNTTLKDEQRRAKNMRHLPFTPRNFNILHILQHNIGERQVYLAIIKLIEKKLKKKFGIDGNMLKEEDARKREEKLQQEAMEQQRKVQQEQQEKEQEKGKEGGEEERAGGNDDDGDDGRDDGELTEKVEL